MTNAGVPSSIRRPAIPWHRRLEAHLLLAVTVIAALSLAAVTVVTGRVVESHSLARAREDLSAAQAAFNHLITTRSEFAHAQTRLITELPVFRAYLTDSRLSSDRDTVEVMVEAYRRDLAADFCIVSSADGRWLASQRFDRHTPAARELLDAGIRAALTPQSVRRIVALDGTLFLVVSEPAMFADELLGTLTAAYRLDDAVAKDLGKITRRHIALVSDGAISGSSLDGDIRQALERQLSAAAVSEPAGEVALRRIGPAQYVGGTFPLDATNPKASAGTLILLEAWEPTQRFIDDITRQLFMAGLLVLGLAVGCSIVLSRRMSRPLREIADVAGEVAAGDWDRRVPVRGSAEAMVMADAFNGMTLSLSHWHDEARRRTDELRAAYERYAAITNSAHDAIVSTDTAGDIVFWNRSAESTFGYTEGEAIGRTLVSLFSEASRDACARTLSEVASSSDDAARTFEGEALRKGGDMFPFELTLASWRAGESIYLTAIVRDTTERRRAQATLEQRDAQLRQSQKMEAIGRLASGVAHDFNNALAVIHGYTEQVMVCLGEHHEHYEDLHEVLKASQSAASLTRQLLTFSRRQTLAPQILSLAEVVENVQRMLQRLLGEEVELSMRLDAGVGTVYADRTQLEQVIVNLCVNARDAMPDGGRVDIHVGRKTLDDIGVCARLGVPRGEYMTLEVSDTGYGMDKETAARIFEPFFTTKESGKGTGLGLALVYGIVTQSRGAIDLETAPGRGTRFRVYLPETEDTDADTDTPLPEETWQGSETVLLVEDEDSVRTILRKSLDAAGYNVLEARSGGEAIAVSRQHSQSIHVLLTDIVMPGMNGLMLSETITAERPDMRVLYMSGHAADAIARHGFDSSTARFLQKPFAFQTLSRELRAALADTSAHR